MCPSSGCNQWHMDKASANPAALDPQTHRILNFVVGFSRWDSVLRTEGRILNPCYEIWKYLH